MCVCDVLLDNDVDTIEELQDKCMRVIPFVADKCFRNESVRYISLRVSELNKKQQTPTGV